MKTELALVGVLLATVASAQAQTPKDLEGCWRIQRIEVQKADAKTEPFGSNPSGQLMFTDSHMTNIAMRPDLPMDFQSGPGPTITTIIAYFGRYKLDGNKLVVTIEGSSRADWRGKTITRTIHQLTKDELTFLDKPQPDTAILVTARRC